MSPWTYLLLLVALAIGGSMIFAGVALVWRGLQLTWRAFNRLLWGE